MYMHVHHDLRPDGFSSQHLPEVILSPALPRGRTFRTRNHCTRRRCNRRYSSIPLFAAQARARPRCRRTGDKHTRPGCGGRRSIASHTRCALRVSNKVQGISVEYNGCCAEKQLSDILPENASARSGAEKARHFVNMDSLPRSRTAHLLLPCRQRLRRASPGQTSRVLVAARLLACQQAGFECRWCDCGYPLGH